MHLDLIEHFLEKCIMIPKENVTGHRNLKLHLIIGMPKYFESFIILFGTNQSFEATS